MVCDRVAILVQGRVVQQGALDDLTAESRRYEIVIEGLAPQWIAERDDVRADAGPDEGTTKLIVRSIEPAAIQPVIDRLRGEERVIVSVASVRETLEDLFMRAITDPTTGAILQPGAAGMGRHGKGASAREATT